MDDSYQAVDFVVVGAGPIGSALALSLTNTSSDTSVVLVDQSAQSEILFGALESEKFDNDFGFRNPGTSTFDTKVFAINAGSKALFEQLGLWSKIQATRSCAYSRMHVWDAEGTSSVDFNADELNIDQLGFIVEAGVIQQVLNSAIEQNPQIKVCRPTKVSHIDWLSSNEANGDINSLPANGSGARVELENGERYLASLVCAADGARSSIRQLSGIDARTENCEQRALVANIELSQPHEHCAWQIFLPTGPLAFLPLESEGNKYCSIVWSLDSELADEIEALDEGEFLIALERAIEGRFGKLKLIGSRLSFPLYQVHASQYGMNGLALVGDAAHSIHPLAGLGANLGFQDVLSLSAEMKRAYERGISYGHSALINRYQRQRRVDNELTLQAMAFFKNTFSYHGMHFNALRNLGLKIFSNCAPLKKLVVQHARIS